MSREVAGLELQINRIVDQYGDTNPQLEEFADALLEELRTMQELPSEFRMLPANLSSLVSESEVCQKGHCDAWAMEGEFFCAHHTPVNE